MGSRARAGCVTNDTVIPRILVIVIVALASAAARADEDDELATVIVTSSRVPQLVKDEPLHVEVVPAEEIEENLTVQPGNVSTLLNELPGARLQSVAAGLGGAGLQLRGLDSGYTQILLDGLPLLGPEPGSFGLLQTPPIDLQRVELIKGAASALYGGSALGGVLNLISRAPPAESMLLANANSRGGSDLLAFIAADGEAPWSGSLTAGVNDQSRQDIDGDGWADLPGYRRYTLRPRLWHRGAAGQSLYLTAGFLDEDRTGGTLRGRTIPDGRAFANTQHTREFDIGAVSDRELTGDLTWSSRGALTSTHLEHVFDLQRIDSQQQTLALETTLRGQGNGHSWLGGIAFAADRFRVRDLPAVSYRYTVPAILAQDEIAPLAWLKIAASGRVDFHNEYGTFVSPRLSLLVHPPDGEWSLRASLGGGFRAPTPRVEQIEATSLAALASLQGLRAERATTASLDAAWADAGWELNASLFSSQVRHALEASASAAGKFALSNASESRRIVGAEALVRFVLGPWHAIGSWSHLDVPQDATLVPRDSGEIALIVEDDKRGRIGLELGYTGTQLLADNPYRARSRPYFELNALAEIRFGAAAIFVNAINLTDVRQTRFDPLLRVVPGPGGNPLTEVWAPLGGRTFNLGIKLEL